LIYLCVDKTGYVVSGMGGGIIWARCGELRDIQQVGRYTDQKEKKIFFIYSIRKFRMEQLQSHI
jgi:hypothetical protein